MSYPPPVPGPPPPGPQLSYDAVRTPEVPVAIRVAVWTFRAAALWALGSAIAFALWVRSSLKDLDNAVSTVDAVADLGLTGRPADITQRVLDTVSNDRWSTLLTAVGVGFVVVALLAAVCYLLIARSISRGSAAARGLATTLSVISLLWLVLGPQAWLWVALNVAGVVAAWRPESTSYLVAAREARRARRGRA